MNDHEPGALSNESDDHTERLLISGQICLAHSADPLEVRRDLLILSRAGEGIGTVAAVCYNGRRGEITHLLLGHLPPTGVYRLVPLSLIDAVCEEFVRLKIAREELAGLPAYEPG